MITNIRKDMKNYLLALEDKAMLRKRSLIESVFNLSGFNPCWVKFPVACHDYYTKK